MITSRCGLMQSEAGISSWQLAVNAYIGMAEETNCKLPTANC